VIFIYLRGDYDCIQNRVQQRTGHFMNPSLLRSQFDTLEEPDDALTIDVSSNPEEMVEEILHKI
jgi:gluconokinase